MGADHLFYVKTIETNARAFFKVIIFSISSVRKPHCHNGVVDMFELGFVLGISVHS